MLSLYLAFGIFEPVATAANPWPRPCDELLTGVISLHLAFGIFDLVATAAYEATAV